MKVALLAVHASVAAALRSPPWGLKQFRSCLRWRTVWLQMQVLDVFPVPVQQIIDRQTARLSLGGRCSACGKPFSH